MDKSADPDLDLHRFLKWIYLGLAGQVLMVIRLG